MKILLVGKFHNSWGVEHFWASALKNEGASVLCLNSSLVPQLDGEGFKLAQKPIDPRTYFDAVIGFQTAPTAPWMPGGPKILIHGELLPTSVEDVSDSVATRKMMDLSAVLSGRNCWHYVLHGNALALNTIRALGEASGVQVYWWPTALMDEEAHTDLSVPVVADLGFYGAMSHRRQKILENWKALTESMGLRFICKGSVYGTEMIKFIRSCKIHLNIHFTDNLNLETRCFEVLGCGRIMISENLSSPSLFPAHLVIQMGAMEPFRADKAEKLLRALLIHLPDWERWGPEGRKFLLSKWTYKEGAKRLLHAIRVIKEGGDECPEDPKLFSFSEPVPS